MHTVLMRGTAAPARPERLPGRRLRPVEGWLVPVSTSAREQARRRLVNAVLLVYLLAIFEGALRKYVAPQFGQYIFFIRDPFLLYAYLLATLHGLWPRRQALLQLTAAMGALGVVLFALQCAIGGLDNTRMILGVYGWRSYFFYVPLAFLVGAQFRHADLIRFAKVTLWLAIPIAALVALQFSSPQGAAINVGVAEDIEYQFKGIGLDAERIRPSGTFTSSTGQGQFVSTACAFLLALMLMPASSRRTGSYLLVLAAGGILTCVALGGSRGMTLSCLILGGFAVALGLIGRGVRLKAKALVLPSAVVALAVALYPIVFPVGFEAFVNRWTTAAAVEQHVQGGVFGRALLGLVDFLRLIDQVPALGYGLGYGGNASTILGATVDGIRPGVLAETDFARHMVDLGPAFGLCYILFRFVVVIWLARIVWLATRRSPEPMPWLLFGYVSLTVLLGQITGHGTINVYGWLFTGLCIAAARSAMETVRHPRLAIPAHRQTDRQRRLRRTPLLGVRGLGSERPAAPPHTA